MLDNRHHLTQEQIDRLGHMVTERGAIKTATFSKRVSGNNDCFVEFADDSCWRIAPIGRVYATAYLFKGEYSIEDCAVCGGYSHRTGDCSDTMVGIDWI